MEIEEIIVKRKCLAISPDNIRINTYIGLGKPFKSNESHWFCNLHFGNLEFPERSAVGVDEWQALQLGMRMMFIELDFKIMTGWKFFWFDETTDDLEELWPYEPKSSSDN